MAPLVEAWLITSTVAIPTLVALWLLAIRKRSTTASRALGVALVGTVWLHPVTQARLAWAPAHELAAELGPFVGGPLSDMAATYGPPRTDAAGGSYYAPTRWYAPLHVLASPAVQVLCFERGVVGYVYLDD